MCGISSIISSKVQPLESFMISSLQQLENRGYDSSGILNVPPNQETQLFKYVFEDNKKPIELLKTKQYIPSQIMIGHNRWATHGEKSVRNAHPHVSMDRSIFLVHNGIIENFKELQQFLLENDFNFYSQTDTEIIVNLLEYYRKKLVSVPFEKIIKHTISDLVGTFSLVIYNIYEYPKIYCVRRGSPLLIAHSKDMVMISSEQSGFSPNMSNYIILANDDICSIECVDNKIHTKTECTYENKLLSNQAISPTTPAPYQHWTIREIYEQPDTLLHALNFGGRVRNRIVRLGGLNSNMDRLQRVDHVIFLGCGTSYNACMCTSFLMKRMCSFQTVTCFDGADFDVHDIPKQGSTVVILVSQSGETRDLYMGLLLCKRLGLFTIGVVNVVDSLIARETDCGVYCYAGREIGVASTKSFFSQVICLFLILLWFRQHVEKKDVLPYLHDMDLLRGQLVSLLENTDSILSSILPKLYGCEKMFLLGKHLDEAIAREGSLKIKEISYIHSEAYSSSSLKHGPFALLDSSMPVILLHSNKKHEKSILSCYEEISSRHSPIVLITPFDDCQKPNTIVVPHNETFSFLLQMIPLQLIAYRLSLHKGLNPDTPRNLAKVVTVE